MTIEKNFSLIVPIHKKKVLSANASTFNYHVVTGKKTYIKECTRDYCETAGWLKNGFKLPEPCKVKVGIANLSKGRFDCVNTYNTVKPIIDTIVSLGLLTDDDSKVIEEISFVRMDREKEWDKDYYYFKLEFIGS